MIEQLFFELIRVAIGTQVSLSRPPSACEWKELYNMAKKQSLVGICFAGLQKLYNSVNQEPSTHNPQPNSTQNQEPSTHNPQPNSTQNQEPRTQNLDEVLYLTWMGMAAKIQQRNEVVNRQCVDLQKRLSADGIHCSILKGQGVASLYSEHLRGLRQSGDIDVWVQNKSIPELVEYVKGLGAGYKATAAHVECSLFPDTDVELHAEPAFFRSFRNDRKLKRWFQSEGFKEFQVFASHPCAGASLRDSLSVATGLKPSSDSLSSRDWSSASSGGFMVPSLEFNLVYMMVHMYHHVLFEGLGLRQLMDYYFVLRQFQEVSKGFRVSGGDLTKTEKTAAASAESHNESFANDCSAEIVSELPSSADQSSAPLSGSADTSAKNIKNILSSIESLGMKRFTTGIMWIMKEVLALEDIYLICEANEKYGRLILEDVMQGGNFGQHDEKNKGLHSDSAIGRSLSGLKRDMKFFALGPWEIMCSPVWSTWHWFWRKRKGFK